MALTYYWTFGDGYSSTEEVPEHTYTKPGKYTVTLTLTDTDTTASATEIYYITVTSQAIYPYKTVKSYTLGLASVLKDDETLVSNSEQGIGFSENSGSWPMPEAKTGVLKILDDRDYQRVLVLDHSDGKFYDISSRNAPDSSGIERIFQDKINVSGVSGVDITPEVTFKEDMGEYERFLIEHLSSRYYVRPDKETDRTVSGHDTKGFLNDLEFTTYLYVDGEPTTDKTKAIDIKKDNEILYDRKAEGHRLQSKLIANKSGFNLVGRQQEYIVKDINYTPNDRVNTENNHQENLSTPLLWATRGDTPSIEKITLQNISGINSYVTGPDTRSNSAFHLTSTFTLPSISDSNAKTLMLFVSGISGTSGSITAQVGANNITLHQHDYDSSWFLLYASGITGSGTITITPNSRADIFDFRLYSGNKTNDLDYYFEDVIENYANNVCPLF